MTFLTPTRVAWINRVVNMSLAGFFLFMAVGALLVSDIGALPGWVGAPVGAFGAILLALASWLAPRRSANIAFDEGYRHDWLRAQAMGFWAFVLAFAIGGNLVAAGLVSLPRAWLAGSMAAAAVPFVAILAMQRGKTE